MRASLGGLKLLFIYFYIKLPSYVSVFYMRNGNILLCLISKFTMLIKHIKYLRPCLERICKILSRFMYVCVAISMNNYVPISSKLSLYSWVQVT